MPTTTIPAPPIEVSITVTVPLDVATRLQRMANRHGKNDTEYIRDALVAIATPPTPKRKQKTHG
jgi:predicted transcriptional regulator